MAFLDDLPEVDSFFGLELKTGAIIIAAISIVHPLFFGCTFCLPISYLFLTTWVLAAIYCATSIILLCGIMKNDPNLCSIWLWYTIVFVLIMMVLMILEVIAVVSRQQCSRLLFVIFGILYYILTVYCILVVNTYRKQLPK